MRGENLAHIKRKRLKTYPSHACLDGRESFKRPSKHGALLLGRKFLFKHERRRGAHTDPPIRREAFNLFEPGGVLREAQEKMPLIIAGAFNHAPNERAF